MNPKTKKIVFVAVSFFFLEWIHPWNDSRHGQLSTEIQTGGGGRHSEHLLHGRGTGLRSHSYLLRYQIRSPRYNEVVGLALPLRQNESQSGRRLSGSHWDAADLRHGREKPGGAVRGVFADLFFRLVTTRVCIGHT